MGIMKQKQLEEMDKSYDETKCLSCGEDKTKEELASGHDFCFECFQEHND